MKQCTTLQLCIFSITVKLNTNLLENIALILLWLCFHCCMAHFCKFILQYFHSEAQGSSYRTTAFSVVHNILEEYSNAIWGPHFVVNQRKVEKVQWIATRLLPHHQDKSYTERVSILFLTDDWNRLPATVVNTNSINAFKSLLDNYLSDSRFTFV